MMQPALQRGSSTRRTVTSGGRARSNRRICLVAIAAACILVLSLHTLFLHQFVTNNGIDLAEAEKEFGEELHLVGLERTHYDRKDRNVHDVNAKVDVLNISDIPLPTHAKEKPLPPVSTAKYVKDTVSPSFAKKRHQLTTMSSEDALWVGNVLPVSKDDEEVIDGTVTSNNLQTVPISIVISYCDKPLDWIHEYLLIPLQHLNTNTTHTATIRDVTIYSSVKCNKQPSFQSCANRTVHSAARHVENFIRSARINGVNDDAEIRVIDFNPVHVGGYNEVYLKWMQSNKGDHSSSDGVVFFLHDDFPYGFEKKLWWSVHDVLRIVSMNGFACIRSVFDNRSHNNDASTKHNTYSIYHNYTDLLMGGANKRELQNLFLGREGTNLALNEQLIPVCNGGSFAVTREQLGQANKSLIRISFGIRQWADFDALNVMIQQSWASILSKPLSLSSAQTLMKRLPYSTCDRWKCGVLTFDPTEQYSSIRAPHHLKCYDIVRMHLDYSYIGVRNDENVTIVERSYTGGAVGESEDRTDILGKLSIVIAHCDKPLDWLKTFIQGHEEEVRDITIYSKCNKDVIGSPKGSKIVRMKNVGRCDHTYASWMSNATDLCSKDTMNDPVLFIKDNNYRSDIWQQRSLKNMLSITAVNGFACMETTTPAMDVHTPNGFVMSVYHHSLLWRSFTLSEYTREEARDKMDNFESQFSTQGDWVDALNLQVPQSILPVCYGGVFMTTRGQIAKQDKSVWTAIEESLSRGDNIVEGHYTERVWAALLTIPLHPSTQWLIRKITSRSKRCTQSWQVRCGVLVSQKEKIYNMTAGLFVSEGLNASYNGTMDVMQNDTAIELLSLE